MTEAESRRVGKGAESAVPTVYSAGHIGGHASLCPPYGPIWSCSTNEYRSDYAAQTCGDHARAFRLVAAADQPQFHCALVHAAGRRLPDPVPGLSTWTW